MQEPDGQEPSDEYEEFVDDSRQLGSPRNPVGNFIFLGFLGILLLIAKLIFD